MRIRVRTVSITARCASCNHLVRNNSRGIRFQSPQGVRVATLRMGTSPFPKQGFNHRKECELQLHGTRTADHGRSVSITARCASCNGKRENTTKEYDEFQSPQGVRTATAKGYIKASKKTFQSPQGVQAATAYSKLLSVPSFSFNHRKVCKLQRIRLNSELKLTKFQSPQGVQAATQQFSVNHATHGFNHRKVCKLQRFSFFSEKIFEKFQSPQGVRAATGGEGGNFRN